MWGYMPALGLEHKYKLTLTTKAVVLKLYTVFSLDGSWKKKKTKKAFENSYQMLFLAFKWTFFPLYSSGLRGLYDPNNWLSNYTKKY